MTSRILLTVVLVVLCVAPAAYAEWVDIGDTHSGTTVYVDSETIRRKGDLVNIWQLHDFKIAPKKAPELFLSSRAQYEYDCAEERTRKLSETWFSGNMGSGEVVHSISDETRWEPVAPGSVGQAMWKAACEKK